jgi:hypothetical protein
MIFRTFLTKKKTLVLIHSNLGNFNFYYLDRLIICNFKQILYINSYFSRRTFNHNVHEFEIKRIERRKAYTCLQLHRVGSYIYEEPVN